jgi:hypothetical protein
VWQTTLLNILHGVMCGGFDLTAFSLLLDDAAVDAGRDEAE